MARMAPMCSGLSLRMTVKKLAFPGGDFGFYVVYHNHEVDALVPGHNVCQIARFA